jgi:hypothetical protein
MLICIYLFTYKATTIDQTINGISLENYTIQFRLNIAIEHSIISSSKDSIDLYFTKDGKKYKIKYVSDASNVAKEIQKWYKNNKKHITISENKYINNLNEDQQKEIFNIIFNNPKIQIDILSTYKELQDNLLEFNQGILDDSIEGRFIFQYAGMHKGNAYKIPEKITTNFVKEIHDIWYDFYLELIKVNQFKETCNENWEKIHAIIDSKFNERLKEQKPTN